MIMKMAPIELLLQVGRLLKVRRRLVVVGACFKLGGRRKQLREWRLLLRYKVLLMHSHWLLLLLLLLGLRLMLLVVDDK